MNQISQVQLDVTQVQTHQGDCQLLVITLLQPGDLFLPSDPAADKSFSQRIQPTELATLTLPAELDLQDGIILFGIAPIWLYAQLIQQCHQAPWIATFDIRSNGAIVIKSSTVSISVGDMIRFPERAKPGIAIAIGGPPDSGKSILSNVLRATLSHYFLHLKRFLHRANWDGEGNWSYETRDRQVVQTLVRRGEYPIHKLPNAAALMQSYFDYHAKAVQNIRDIVDLAIVDLGGKPQPEKIPVIEQCTHYLIISSQPEAIPAWHDLLGKHLKPLAVLHSKSPPHRQLTDSPYLEQIIDLEELLQTQRVSDKLLGAIADLSL